MLYVSRKSNNILILRAIVCMNGAVLALFNSKKFLFSMIFTRVVIFFEIRKNPKFEDLKINNSQDMAILKFFENKNFARIYYLGTLRAFFPRCH